MPYFTCDLLLECKVGLRNILGFDNEILVQNPFKSSQAASLLLSVLSFCYLFKSIEVVLDSLQRWSNVLASTRFGTARGILHLWSSVEVIFLLEEFWTTHDLNII